VPPRETSGPEGRRRPSCTAKRNDPMKAMGGAQKETGPEKPDRFFSQIGRRP
jgi:hypothetical protein